MVLNGVSSSFITSRNPYVDVQPAISFGGTNGFNGTIDISNMNMPNVWTWNGHNTTTPDWNVEPLCELGKITIENGAISDLKINYPIELVKFSDLEHLNLPQGGGGSGYQMFDIVMKDHVLSYEESLGFAPLGTYVYKEAIAGTRYGYPDFYADVVAEYQDLNNTTDTVDSVTVTINANGHKFYDIADKATFDNMYAITGEAWYYGIDTTNERIFLPRSTRFKNGTSSDVGEYNPAGLPNITGQVGYYSRNTELATTGSLYKVSEQWVGTGGGSGGQYVAGIGIDASLSNSIYGASNTVEYSSTKLIPYMVVGNQSTWSGMTDVVNQGMTILSQVNAGLATKLDLDLTNITNSTKSTIAGYAMPSDTYEDLTLGASGATYTAPANGYYLFDKEGLNGGEYALLTTSRNAQTITQFEGSVPSAYFHLCWLIPVAKGDVLFTQYTLSGVTTYFRFIYAQGSESEAN